MAKCFVKNLKENVEDSSLEKLGYFNIPIKVNSEPFDYTQVFRIKYIVPSTIYSVGCQIQYPYGTNRGYEFQNISDMNLYIENKEGILRVKKKGLLALKSSAFSVNLEVLKYCHELVNFDCPCYGDIKNIPNNNNLEISLGSYVGTIYLEDIKRLNNMVLFSCSVPKEIIGKLRDFSVCTKLHTLRLSTIKLSDTDWKLSDLGENTSLLEITFSNGYNNSVLEEFVAAQVRSGRKTCSGIFINNLQKIYFNSVYYNTNIGNKSVSWTPNLTDNTKTDVTLNGVTVTIDANN